MRRGTSPTRTGEEDRMTGPGSRLVEELRTRIGVETEAVVLPPVTQEQIARYCFAVDDIDPLYLDDTAARDGPHGQIVAPPLFSGTPSFPPASLSALRPDGLPSSDSDPLRPPIPGGQTRLTGASFEFFRPVRLGDVLTSRSRLDDVYEREGRAGTMVFSVKETRVEDVSGAPVHIEKVTTAAILDGGSAATGSWSGLDLRVRERAQSIGPRSPEPSPWELAVAGSPLPTIARRITPVQVFLYGALKRNSHLIHYDQEHAHHEGLPERVAQGDLLADFLCQVATRWANPHGTIRSFRYEARGPAFVGEEIRNVGTVIDRRVESGVEMFGIDLRSEGSDGRLCLRGAAVVAFP